MVREGTVKKGVRAGCAARASARRVVGRRRPFFFFFFFFFFVAFAALQVPLPVAVTAFAFAKFCFVLQSFVLFCAAQCAHALAAAAFFLLETDIAHCINRPALSCAISHLLQQDALWTVTKSSALTLETRDPLWRRSLLFHRALLAFTVCAPP